MNRPTFRLTLLVTCLAVACSALIAIAASQGYITAGTGRSYKWEWAKPGEVSVRTSAEFTEAEQKRGCWLDFPVDDTERLMHFRCPAPFSPYGVLFGSACIVKEGEVLKRAKVVIVRDERNLYACVVTRKPPIGPNAWIYVGDGSGDIAAAERVTRDRDGNFVWRDATGGFIDYVTKVRCRDYQRVAGPFSDPRVCR